MSKSKSNKLSTPVKVATISAITTIFVAFITSPWWFEKLFPQQTSQPASILIIGVEDENSNPLRKDDAPFKVAVHLRVTNATGRYLYLVVDDSHGHWIQPDLGKVGEGTQYSAFCYLGRQNENESLNKTYRIYAIITDTQYQEGDQLNLSTVEVQSDGVELYRTH